MTGECTDHSKYPLPTYKTTQRYYQMVNNEIKLIIFFVAKDVEALYRRQGQDLELIEAQIMSKIQA